MRIIADLQIHSKYARACSKELKPKNIGAWADKKGIHVVGTGDFTHPMWLKELKDNLEETKPGLYQLKDKSARAYFLLAGEVSSIYKQGDKVRRVHNMILASSFEAVDRIRKGLEATGANLKSDGRPIMGVHCDDLVKIVRKADSKSVVIPAHVWTPHFGVFGSLSGFDSIEEAYGDQAKHIFAIETGLSSDPKMNWQLSSLDKYALISNSDAHSLRKLGREANVFEIPENQLSYTSILRSMKVKDPKSFLYTIEFFPEEGKYHLDGHRDCKFSCLPEDTQRHKGICPKCGKKLLVGVLSRVEELADRKHGFVPPGAIPFKSVIPLEEVISATIGVGVTSKKVTVIYEQMVTKHPEFVILLDLPKDEIAAISNPMIAESVVRVREGKVNVAGGYDGVFGKIQIYTEAERKKLLMKSEQESLF
ncbi:MAG: endonuclease Q family protein [bacterium]|nr:endonuclease Q family protein [bacterium]